MSAAENIKRELDMCFAQGKRTFAKLRKNIMPYRFDDWGTDEYSYVCLYYFIGARKPEKRDNKKRVPLDELVAALSECLDNGVLTREAFEERCPIAQSAGGCGFAVTGRCLELLGVARYGGQGKGFVLTDKARASDLLK
jgi:hypothetical protein